ncbi:hypothetical protein EHM92_03345, partial [bacterium]
PHLIGWMVATVSFSDLAAVGATPLGLLVSETLPPDLAEEYLNEIQKGVEEACRACGSYVLGGDTNSGSALELTGCAVGIIEGNDPLSRVGCHPGDSLYCSGPLGSGNAFAIGRLFSPRARHPFAPNARVREGQLIRQIANACMDTSDGALATLDQLMRVNGTGFQLDGRWGAALDAQAAGVAADAAIPAWLLLAGQHGEFELLFTVGPEREAELLSRAASVDWHPIRLGTVILRQEISLEVYGRTSHIGTARIRNAAFTARRSVEEYVHELLSIDGELQKGEVHHGEQ